ncbi:AIPR family protein [Rathayibacter agropyri]|uniref:AIPR family protein n=1 Tax=Rathayibacter agropyri TaxID=1634927 RepID=UPI0015630D9E|nr:AIPR family protein [Rathayibacter agropyri]NRD07625.1 AIPR family protein [Rathayibacter agropyri]
MRERLTLSPIAAERCPNGDARLALALAAGIGALDKPSRRYYQCNNAVGIVAVAEQGEQLHTLTGKRVAKFARDFGFEVSEDKQFELYVAANYLYAYLRDDVEKIERSVRGGGGDEGIDIAAVVVNGQLVFEPSEIEELISEQASNTARVCFIQAKTSESYDAKLISKFLHGIESVTKYAIDPQSIALPAELVDLAALIDKIAENGDKFQETRIPCEVLYVTTSGHDGADARKELQVTEAVRRIKELGVYTEPFELKTHGHDALSAKLKERHGPQNIRFDFTKRQTIPATERVSEAYIGLLSGTEALKLLTDETGSIRPGIFDDNVRLDLGAHNTVNLRITRTLESEERAQFPFLNNGLTIIASSLRGAGDKFFISGYQIVNGGQTSHQLVRWAASQKVKENPELLSDLWIPVKIVSSDDASVRTSVAIATNLQTAIGSTDIQASSQTAKDVEEYFTQSGADGLRYLRQIQHAALDFPRTRVVTTPELNRAVAATLFGESFRAIGSPKELEAEDSFVWGSYSVEAYYYAAWILYRVDRYFARTPDSTTLKAAKYHIAMMVSVIINPQIAPVFEAGDLESARRKLVAVKRTQFKVTDSDRIEFAISKAMELATDQFQTVLSEGRSLRKDDVRNRRHQEALLQKAKAVKPQA